MSLQRKNRQRGKRTEKATAELLKGMRVGILGSEDVKHPKYSIECKDLAAFAGFKFMEQCVRNNTSQKVPLVVVHLRGKRREDDLVMMKMSDFLKGEENAA